MRVIVLGGDGFCGWPTSLHLSDKGHDILIIDDFSRRNIDNELQTSSLTPIGTLNQRIDAWKEISGREIQFKNINVAEEYSEFLAAIVEYKPDTIIHFAEQRAAPYSMKSSKHRRYTVDNNLNATHNALSAIVESGMDIHLVHLGTMGVYGYGTFGATIPEGYLHVKVEADDTVIEKDILYPADPGSIYHMTKTQDALFFYYYNKNYKTRITDLHQGIVWGTNTKQTAMDERLINRFDYDSDFGTVLNRFLMQAAVGHPMTVYGEGGQTRGFIHIQNTVECLELAVINPPEKGERVKILNQLTETHRLIDLANKIKELTNAEIQFIPTPRNEAARNELMASNKLFLSLGLKPILLEDGLMMEVRDVASKYKDNADLSMIPPVSFWNNK